MVAPSYVALKVALIVEYFLYVSVHVIVTLHGETADKHFRIVVSAFHLAKPVVRTLATQGMRRDVLVVTDKQYINEIMVRVVVQVGDVGLDGIVVVAASFGHAHHGGGTA